MVEEIIYTSTARGDENRDQDLQKLAEDVAEWLGIPQTHPDHWFRSKFSPNLLHLAQEKAEREGFGWILEADVLSTGIRYCAEIGLADAAECLNSDGWFESSFYENNYIAFFTALMEAVRWRKPVTGGEG